jgi:four helix bundle protein
MRQNLIQDRTFQFALDIIRIYGQMKEQQEYVLSKQLLRCGTSIGANVEEAIGAQSKRDFLSKMNISLKETRETNYWLRLLKNSKLVNVDFDETLKESKEIMNIISAIVKTTKENVYTNS